MATLNDHKQRTHALLSASSSHRWLNCPPSALVSANYADEGSEFAAEGTLAHEVAEWVASGKSKTEILNLGVEDGVTVEMLDCAREYGDYVQEQITSTVPMVLFEQLVDFSPWVPDGFGTCDCIILQDDTMIVIDYKYGKGVPVSAIDNSQLRLYALGALNDFGIAYDVKRVEMHIFQPRIGNISTEALSTAELLQWGETVKPVANMAARGKGKYKAGAHCKFCPHAGKCRALTALCTEKIEAYGISTKTPKLAPHEVAEVLEFEPIFNLWLKRVKAQALDTLLSGGQVPGYKAVLGRGSRQWADEYRVVEILKDSGYTPEYYTKTELLSPSGMESSLGKATATKLLGGLVIKKDGAPTIAPDTDKRPAYSSLEAARKDFE